MPQAGAPGGLTPPHRQHRAPDFPRACSTRSLSSVRPRLCRASCAARSGSSCAKRKNSIEIVTCSMHCWGDAAPALHGAQDIDRSVKGGRHHRRNSLMPDLNRTTPPSCCWRSSVGMLWPRTAACHSSVSWRCLADARSSGTGRSRGWGDATRAAPSPRAFLREIGVSCGAREPPIARLTQIIPENSTFMMAVGFTPRCVSRCFLRCRAVAAAIGNATRERSANPSAPRAA